MAKNFFKDKAAGYYLTAVTAVLSLLIAILCVSFYGSSADMAWGIFIFPLLAFIIAAALIVVPIFVPSLKKMLAPFAPWALLIATVFALGQYIHMGYLLITQIGVGRADDIASLIGADLYVCAILFVVTAILATVSVCLKQYKDIPNLQAETKASAAEESKAADEVKPVTGEPQAAEEATPAVGTEPDAKPANEESMAEAKPAAEEPKAADAAPVAQEPNADTAGETPKPKAKSKTKSSAASRKEGKDNE